MCRHGWRTKGRRVSAALPSVLLGGIAALVPLPLPVQAAPAWPPDVPLRQVIAPPIIPVPSPTPAGGEPASADAWRVADTGGLPARVRAGPSLGAPVVLRLDPGTVVKPLGETASADGYEWRRIAAPGGEGWIAGSLLLEPEAPPTAPVYFVAAVGEHGLNVRERPSTAAAIVASLPEGAVVEPVSGPVEAEGRRWRQVRVDGTAGWVVAEAIDQR